MFQEYVQKSFEVRVTAVGETIFAAAIHSQMSPRSRVDWRRYDLDHTPYEPHSLPRVIEEKCYKLMAILGLHYGALDFIVQPDGKYVFLEINPVGQWGWIEYLTGLPITEAIADLLIERAH